MNALKNLLLLKMKKKNRTDSDDERSEKDEKIIKKKEETEVIIQNNNVGYKNIRESKIKNCECSSDKKIENKNIEVIPIQHEENRQNKGNMNFQLYKRFKEKDSDYNDKKININSSPSDIINASMLDSEMDNIIENEQIKKDKSLYDSIQTKIKKILLKGHLPIFDIDNYKIEKQIGEGSFGLI